MSRSAYRWAAFSFYFNLAEVTKTRSWYLRSQSKSLGFGFDLPKPMDQLNPMRNRYFLSLCLSLFTLSLAYSQESTNQPKTTAGSTAPLTLAQAIAIALGSQPSIATSTATREAQEQRLKQTQARFLPSVTPTYNYQNQYTFGKQTVFLGGGVVTELPSGKTTTTRQEQVSLSFRVFDSGDRKSVV